MENNISAIGSTFYNPQQTIHPDAAKDVRTEKTQENQHANVSYENAVMDEESMKRFFYLISGIPYEVEDKESRWA
ncbi:MAG: hypothetical protein KAZ87_04115 [Spirochaetes bacterium]|nr:hypothetical protein [Spirochaetota bacterium]